MQHRASARGSSVDSNVSRVPTKLVNVLLHPLEEEALIHQARVEGAVSSDLIARQEAKGADSIVEGDNDNVIARLSDEIGSIVVRVV